MADRQQPRRPRKRSVRASGDPRSTSVRSGSDPRRASEREDSNPRSASRRASVSADNASRSASAGEGGASRRTSEREDGAPRRRSVRAGRVTDQRNRTQDYAMLRRLFPAALLRSTTDAAGWRALLERSRLYRFGRWAALCFLVVLACVFASNVLLPDKAFSDSENRVLAQMPQPTRASITNGEFMGKAEDYVSDQFVGRDAWVTLKVTLERLTGRKESNGVFLGKGGMLFEEPAAPAWDDIQTNMQAANDFAARHQDVSAYFCLVPNAFAVQSALLPANAPVRDQQADIDRIFSMADAPLTCFDAGEALRAHTDEYLFYRTDHHWTSLGANYAFQALAPVMGIDPAAASYDALWLTNDFQGTLASKSGYHGSRDSIGAYHPAGDAGSYVVEYADAAGTTTSVFDAEKLQEKDKYQVFLGGNHARVTIYTTATNKKNLLVLKDSYANCFIPFLLPFYESITVVDPRYYYEDLDALVANNSITDVLYLYNVNTFVEDNSLAQVLAPAPAAEG